MEEIRPEHAGRLAMGSLHNGEVNGQRKQLLNYYCKLMKTQSITRYCGSKGFLKPAIFRGMR